MAFTLRIARKQSSISSRTTNVRVSSVATVVDDSLVLYNKQRRFDDFIATLRLQIPIALQEVSVLCGLRIIRDMDGCYLTVD
jgi:hypothetical protein